MVAAQHRVHWTLGILRDFQARFASGFEFSLIPSRVPAPAPVTQTVETVEKVGQKRWKASGFWCSAQHFGNF